MIERVLVPLDGSRIAERALAAATSLARPGKGTVVLLHALVSPVLAEQERARAERYLGRIARRLRARGVRVEKRLVSGEASRQILRAALGDAVDLIAISGRGQGAAKAGPLGSVAERVLRAAPVPVLLVRGATRLNRVVVPLGGAAPNLRTLTKIAETARSFGTKVVLLHAESTHLREAAVDVFARLGVPSQVHPRNIRADRRDLIVIPLRVREGVRWSGMRFKDEEILRRAEQSVLVVPVEGGGIQSLGA